jgi:hypothetical protein
MALSAGLTVLLMTLLSLLVAGFVAPRPYIARRPIGYGPGMGTRGLPRTS